MSSPSRSVRCGLLAALLFAASASAAAQEAGPAARTPQSSATEHRGEFNGEAVFYRAVVAETFLKGEDGAPDASVVTTSYLRSEVINPAARPVMFLFNGGPGASTTPFHFDFFGPRRRIGEGADQRMVNNPDCPLDAVDLVFIDPVGTGYSRPLPGADGARYWTRTSDARSVQYVIEEWLRTHGRSASPRYLAGQSYGTVRAATILAAAADLEFDGVLLFALLGNASGDEMPHVVTLPTMAAIAWHHERIERNGRTVEQVFDEAVQFARDDYVTALIQGGSLPQDGMRAIAARMSSLVGLPAAFIEERKLRLSKDDFIFNLLKDQGLRTGQLDGRATARLDAPPQRPPYDDPGISYTPDPPPPVPKRAPAEDAAAAQPSALERYYRHDLRFESAEQYIPLNLDVNQAWKAEGAYGENVTFQTTEAVAAAMQARPKMRLFWVAGLYDLSTPAYAGRYALNRAGVPASRLTAVRLPGGHSVYKDETNRGALSEAVRRFVTEVAAAADDAEPRSFVTRHRGVFNGTAVEYTATVSEFLERDQQGNVTARLVATSYVREDVADRASRPVLFLWNGGPGAASLWLHFGAFGPKRVDLPADVNADVTLPYRLADNGHSVLDVADLVFMDPAGTGYSRRAGESQPKFTPATDAESAANLIRAWVRAQHRESSPRFVLGESYGTIRAVLVAEELKDDLPLAGFYLFGQGVNLVETTQRAGNIVGYATNLPALAAIAWYHGRVHRRYREVSQLIEEAWAFGMGDYLPALAHDDGLSDRERRRIARRLEELSGITAEYYLANGLTISKQHFRREILKDRGLTVGFYDGRYTAPLPGPDEPLPDPSMKFRDAFVTSAPEHYKHTLAVTLDEEYRPSDPQASSFDWSVPATPFADYDYAAVLTRTLRAQPCLRLAIGTGIYDTTTTVGPARYLVARSKLPRERVSLHQYDGGHMAYSNAEALAKMAQDVRALLRPADCR